jgi:7-cyano-7-deazaguanine synthase
MSKEHPEKALLLLSGGMDSTTLLWWMRARDIETIHTVGIDYGQRHRIELEFSAVLSKQGGGTDHRVIELDMTQIGGSPLTSDGLNVPTAAAGRQIDTVVPYRNMLFVTAAAAYGETIGVSDLFISPVKDDYSAYRDCRRAFYDALETALSLGATREAQVRIHTPFVECPKTEVIAEGLRLGVPYGQTHTCYNGTRPACGRCDACIERINAFIENGQRDPIDYAVEVDWRMP